LEDIFMEQRGRRRMKWGLALLMRASFVGAALVGQQTMAQNKKPTAREVVAAIQEHVGIPWLKETVDTFKAGDPDTPGRESR
jgi:hypothetical protein